MNVKWIFTAALAGAISLLPAYAASSSQKLSHQDKTWLTKAHQTNLAEVKAGRMAEHKGHDHDVKSAGMTLVSDHSMLDAKLKPLAMSLHVSLPSAPTAQQQATAQQLSSKSGTAFDRAWTQKMIAGHQKAIRMTQQEISQGSSSKVKQLAQTALPVLQKHLRLIRNAKG